MLCLPEQLIQYVGGVFLIQCSVNIRALWVNEFFSLLLEHIAISFFFHFHK